MVELTKIHAENSGRLALKNVSLAVPTAALFVVLGPNGSGKSTLVRLISGQQQPTQGEIFWGLRSQSRDNRATPGATELAYLPQQTETPAGLTVRDVVALGRAPYQDAWQNPSEHDVDAVEWALSTCGLIELSHRRADQLSGGEQRRVHVARVLAQRTPWLVLDEPLSGLDPKQSMAIFDVISGIVRQENRTVVSVVHDINIALTFATHVALLRRGELVAAGPVSEVINKTSLEDTFETKFAEVFTENKALFYVPVRD